MAGTTFNFDAIGTAWVIEIMQDIQAGAANQLLKAVKNRIAIFDQDYSRFKDDSLVMEMSRKAGTYALPADAKQLLDTYLCLYEATGGAVTPLIGQALSDAGYDAAYTLKPRAVTAPPAWDSVLDYNFPNLTLTRPALLDFGAAGKGYLADIISQLLVDNGIGNYCINAGGDFVCEIGSAPIASPVDTDSGNGGSELSSRTVGGVFDIALEHPDDQDLAIGIAHLPGGSLCGSAGNRRSWHEYTHILDPKTLESPRGIKAVWVSAASGLVADGVATALYFASPDDLKQQFDFEYAMIRDDMTIQHSAHFPGIFFTEQSPAGRS